MVNSSGSMRRSKMSCSTLCCPLKPGKPISPEENASAASPDQDSLKPELDLRPLKVEAFALRFGGLVLELRSLPPLRESFIADWLKDGEPPNPRSWVVPNPEDSIRWRGTCAHVLIKAKWFVFLLGRLKGRRGGWSRWVDQQQRLGSGFGSERRG